MDHPDEPPDWERLLSAERHLQALGEVLAQLLDRGRVCDWRALYQLAVEEPALRSRIVRLCQTVPIGFAHLFLAAMAGLGEPVEHWPPAARGGGDDWV